MNVTAVIAEYNPFHNGHLYQLRTIREQGADYIIIIMSGDFMQRGIPAIVSKYERCRMALSNGADLVFELPVYSALGSAEYFAQGAVSMLDKLGIVDVLHFGSESGDIALLTESAKIIAHETTSYKASLNNYLRQGISFPAARDKALSDSFSGRNIEQIIKMPNNILGMEYIKALIQRNSSIKPATLVRKGAGYSSDLLVSGSFVSANAIRTALSAQKDSEVREHMPDSVYEMLGQTLLFANDFSEICLYKMLQLSANKESFAGYYDVGKQLSHTLYGNLYHYTSFDGFALKNKTKNLTFSRICRSLMHILLDMTQDNADCFKQYDYVQYARLLGFTKHGQELLKSIKANTSIPVLTKPSAARKQLSGAALMSFQADIYAATIYESVRNQKIQRLSGYSAKESVRNEFTSEIIKLP